MAVKKKVKKVIGKKKIVLPERYYKIISTDQDAQEQVEVFIERHNKKIYQLYLDFKEVEIVDTKLVWDGQYHNIFTYVDV